MPAALFLRIFVACVFLAGCTPPTDFSPQSYDTKQAMPKMWKGMDWDTAAWNKNWTTDSTLTKMFQNGVFHRNYMQDGMARLEVGARFYDLSELDRNRSLKLLADRSGIFASVPSIELRDWHSGGVIGTYTKDGLVMR